MITGRIRAGHFVYVFGIEGLPLNPRNARCTKRRSKIVTEFEGYARAQARVGNKAYGAIYNFPTEEGMRAWVGSNKLPEHTDMTITATNRGTAKIVRSGA